MYIYSIVLTLFVQMKLLVIAYQHNIFKGYKAKKRIEPFIEQDEHKRNHFYSKRNLKLKNAFLYRTLPFSPNIVQR